MRMTALILSLNIILITDKSIGGQICSVSCVQLRHSASQELFWDQQRLQRFCAVNPLGSYLWCGSSSRDRPSMSFNERFITFPLLNLHPHRHTATARAARAHAHIKRTCTSPSAPRVFFLIYAAEVQPEAENRRRSRDTHTYTHTGQSGLLVVLIH